MFSIASVTKSCLMSHAPLCQLLGFSLAKLFVISRNEPHPLLPADLRLVSSLSLQSTVPVPLPALCVADNISACLLLLQEAFPDHLSTQVRAGVILWCLSSSSIHSHHPSSSLSLAPSEVRQPLQK